MIEFIFVAIVLSYLLLVIGFWIKSYPLTVISAMAVMVVGVYIVINGIEQIDNILTYGLAVVNIGVGAYVFISGSLEQLEQ